MGRTIAILTDFGNKDHYTGVMKGVIRGISPFADMIDISNEVAAGDIRSAAFILESSYKYFPQNTVFLCVIDPGVGNNRRAIAVESDNRFFVAPDNGLLTPVILSSKNFKAVSLTNPVFQLSQVSSTFHGRDIFAPAAAYISKKVELEEFGEKIEKDSLIILDNYSAKIEDNTISGNIVHTDTYGNLITDIPSEWVIKKKRDKDLSCRI